MPAIAAPALPLFFKRIVGLDPKAHGALRLDRAAGFGFAAGAQFVPLGLGEIEVAAQDYPILFSSDAEPLPVALLGLEQGSNLFVGPDGAWKADAYVPACVRAFPFVLVAADASDDLYLGVEPDAACLHAEGGEMLFADGKPSAALNEAIAFGTVHRNNLIAAGAFARALDVAGLLEEEGAKIDFAAGGSALIRGFKTARRERLASIGDEIFLDWRRRDWLPAIYAHLSSARSWRRLIDMTAAARQRR
jgi:SapC protein